VSRCRSNPPAARPLFMDGWPSGKRRGIEEPKTSIVNLWGRDTRSSRGRQTQSLPGLCRLSGNLNFTVYSCLLHNKIRTFALQLTTVNRSRARAKSASVVLRLAAAQQLGINIDRLTKLKDATLTESVSSVACYRLERHSTSAEISSLEHGPKARVCQQ